MAGLMYGQLFNTLATKGANLNTDTLKVMLCTSSLVANPT